MDPNRSDHGCDSALDPGFLRPLRDSGTRCTSHPSNRTIHGITRQRFNGGAAYVWPQTTTPGPLYYQATRDDATQTSPFVIPLTDAWKAGFYFKLVGHGIDVHFGGPCLFGS